MPVTVSISSEAIARTFVDAAGSEQEGQGENQYQIQDDDAGGF